MGGAQLKVREVENQDLWIKLYGLAHSLYDTTGAAIDFWHVPRGENRDTDLLANACLDRRILAERRLHSLLKGMERL
ncbi:hypothetical protein RRF57_008214 [Xylaria bambusicola]|uniref:Uncharacterized protein n=1 Tax=Xylaria bambusicola TaxID=326684 RepID=A0AAN7UHC2_9PEZI